jgi:predicted NAD-dependent protein-ADP-ribosyltransferase YbiA (DUF1768 family)
MKVSNALRVAGFKSPEEVQRLLRKISGVTQADQAWEQVRTKLVLRYHADLSPTYKPTKETWELVKVIAALSEDDALDAIARRMLSGVSPEQPEDKSRKKEKTKP